MSLNTNGEYFHAESSDVLTKIYEEIYVYETMDKTDDDKDGLCDVVERVGIRLINGQIIFTDSELDDTDDDGLLDGQEVNPTPKKCYREMNIDGNKEIKRIYAFTWNSDPSNPDSDGDGALDGEDYTPLSYNESRSYIFCGENAEKFLKNEAETRYKVMTNLGDKTVQIMRTSSVNSFCDKWSQMGMLGDKIAYRIEEVHVIYHGGPRGIAIDRNGCLLADARVSKDNSRYTIGEDVTINQLDNKNIYYLNLSCCNNGNIDFMDSHGIVGYYDNMAISFLKSSKHNIQKITAWDGSAVFNGNYASINGFNLYYVDEYSKSSDMFKMWSKEVNDYERMPEQRVYYWKDTEGNIHYSTDYDGEYGVNLY